MPECYYFPFHTWAFSFIRNDKLLAVGSDYTDPSLLLSRVKQHLLSTCYVSCSVNLMLNVMLSQTASESAGGKRCDLMLQGIAESIEQQEDDALLKSLIDLAESAPKFLRSQLEAIVNLCMKVRQSLLFKILYSLKYFKL